MNVKIPDVYPQIKVVQESLVVDSFPKLTNNDWIREHSEDSSIGPIIHLLKSDKLKNYVAKELRFIWYACSNEVLETCF